MSESTKRPAESHIEEQFPQKSRLERLLSDALKNPVVMLTGGTGFGKTQAVSSFLTKTNARVIWVQLTRLDNISSRFWDSFVAALSSWNMELATVLYECGFPASAPDFDHFIHMFAKAAYKEEQVILVLDDLQRMREGAVSEFIENMIHVGIENTTILLISGADIEVNLSGITGDKQVVKITDSQLNFTLEEVENYFLAQGEKLTKKQVERIFEYTQGWAFAIYIIGIYMKRTGKTDMDPVMQITPMIFEVLEKEIFPEFTEKMQKALVLLSFLGTFPVELIHELVKENIEELMEKVDTSILVGYNPYTKSYYFHNIFREFLNRKRYMVSEEEKKDLYGKVAVWYDQQGRTMEAMEYYMRCGNYDKILESLLRIGMYRYPKDVIDKGREIINSFPQEFIEKNPMARFIEAHIHFCNLEMDVAVRLQMELMKSLEKGSQTEENKKVLGEVYVYMAFYSMILGTHEFVHYFKLASETLPNGSRFVTRKGQFLGTDNVLSLASCEKGEMDRTIREYFEAKPYSDAVLNGGGYGREYLGAAEGAYCRGNFSEARKNAFQAIYKAGEKEQYDIVCSAYQVLIRISFAEGKYVDIMTYLQAVKDAAANIEEHNFFTWPDVVTSWFSLKVERPENTAKWIRDDNLNRKVLPPLDYSKDREVKGLYLLTIGKYHELIAYLDNSFELAIMRGQTFLRLKMTIMKAIALNLLDEREEAVQVLQEAYNQAYQNDIIMQFVEFGRYMRTLIECARNSTAHSMSKAWLDTIYTKSSTYAKRQIYIRGQYEEVYRKERTPLDTLSRREQEVLGGICQGLTREEIADSLGVSVNTVKTVVQNVYNKLGAVNRADAVHIATLLGFGS